MQLEGDQGMKDMETRCGAGLHVPGSASRYADGPISVSRKETPQ